jgi:hypothetical protein
MADNGLSCPLFILDWQSIKEILNGRALNNRYFKIMMTRKKENKPFVAITNTSSFHRALSMCSGSIPSDNVRFIMELLKIYPSKANYKNANEVNEEFEKFTRLMSEGAL